MARVAVVQMISSTGVEENLEAVEYFLLQAKEAQAELVLLPENVAHMGKDEHEKWKISEVYGQGPIQHALSRLAKKFHLWIIAGTIPIKGQGTRVRSSSLVYDAEGRCVTRYDKIHLFDVRVNEHEWYQESAAIEPGTDLVVVDTPVGKVGLSVCYDLRFPELYHALERQGAELITVPSAFTKVTGEAHWHVLLRARAIENSCYVLAANQGGVHENGRMTYGHSTIIDPWGKVLVERNEGTGIIIADIDLTELHELRKKFPTTNHHVLNIKGK